MVKLFRRSRFGSRLKITALSVLTLLVTILALGAQIGITLAAPAFSNPAAAAQGRQLYEPDMHIRKDGLAFVVATSFNVNSANEHIRNWLSLTVLNNGASYADSVNVDKDANTTPVKYPAIAFSPTDGTGYVVWRTTQYADTYEAAIRIIPPAYNGTTNKTFGAQIRLQDKTGWTLDQPAVAVDSAGYVYVAGYAYNTGQAVQLRMVKLDPAQNYGVISTTILDTQPAGQRQEMDPIMCIDPANNIHVVSTFPVGSDPNNPSTIIAYSNVNGRGFVKTPFYSTVRELRGGKGKDIVCGPDGTVYVAVNNRGNNLYQYDLFKRTPGSGGSEKWSKAASNVFGNGADAVSVTVGSDGKLWVAQADGLSSSLYGANVKYSTDGGATFSSNERAIPTGQDSIISYVAIDANGPGGKVHLIDSYEFDYSVYTTQYAIAGYDGVIPPATPGTPEPPGSPLPTVAPGPDPSVPPTSGSGTNLAAPTSLSATAVSSREIDLTWKDKSTGEQDYRVERKTGNGGWAEIASLAANSTAYNDNTLNLNTSYTYRVRTRLNDTYTGYSNEAGASTLGPVTLAFATQPGSAQVGAALNPQPVVNILDKNGKPVTNYSGQVILSISTNPGGANLSGNTATVSNGVATFSSAALDKPGNGYVLTASANPAISNNSAVSVGFNVTTTAVVTPPDLGQDQRNAPFGLTQFQTLWERSDKAIVDGKTSRSWTWGPSITGLITEPYTEGGTRQVQYFDKTRMEQTSGRDVTNGLLAKELITGLMQFGDNTFTQFPANNYIKIAGDQDATQNPTYASFRKVSTIDQENHAPQAGGQVVNVFLKADGTVGSDDTLGAKYNVKNQYYDNTLQHNIPDVFWNFMNQTGPIFVNGAYTTGPVVDWLSTMGLPLSEAYWTRSVVAGVEQDVLIQVFERRVLTYTPSNSAAYRVEMGNVGQHYREWRKAVLSAPPVNVTSN